MNFYNIVALVSALLIVLLVLVQTRGASLGAGLSSSAEINITRRGTEKTIFQITIITAIIFTGSLLMGIMTS